MTRRIVTPDGTAPIGDASAAPHPGHADHDAITSNDPAAGAPNHALAEQMTLPHTDDVHVDPALRPDRTNQPQAGEQFGSEFLDNVAHQMVAPLQSIEMHCVNILNGTVPKDRHDMRLKEVIGHARMLTDLARRMRFLHELVSGKLIDTEQLPFRTIVTVWIEGFNNYLPAAQKRNVDVDIDHEKMNTLPDVVASRLAVQQVVMNLYDNGLKYGRPNSKIMVRARRVGSFIVNEFGHGAGVTLTQEAATRMFERGYRAEEARRARASGTGIGMWISQQLMRSMQGEIRSIPTDASRVNRFRLYWRIAP